MVLVNVHPDYLRFPGESARASTFPVERYEELLQHIRQHHGAAVWHALPREVARFVRRTMAPTAAVKSAS
jgi:hypothetical protein